MASDPLLQTQLSPELFARFAKERERWGMSNRELLSRILEDALPKWECAEGPPLPSIVAEG